jgi:hypothetical protein
MDENIRVRRLVLCTKKGLVFVSSQATVNRQRRGYPRSVRLSFTLERTETGPFITILLRQNFISYLFCFLKFQNCPSDETWANFLEVLVGDPVIFF